ncbi:hypothetical protein L596_030656 [Steinernema carpocapsae]|uniref:Uncharacterized protein n=1 Tax=Steinernema carpocapsae TaxID=34508 RepID=A0A4U5LQ27_STECR|nr:hypothetical protein L596_030656 [Steinernema carpocapsae]
MNRTVKELLTKSITDVASWDVDLPLILMSIKSHITRATGFSAFELLTGLKMRWPEDVATGLRLFKRRRSVRNAIGRRICDIDINLIVCSEGQTEMLGAALPPRSP